MNQHGTVVIIIFIIGYVLIAFEHPVKINKSATAIVTGVLCWTIYAMSSQDHIEDVTHNLAEHFGEISAILFFLLGAMTIVELVDAHLVQVFLLAVTGASVVRRPAAGSLVPIILSVLLTDAPQIGTICTV